MLLLSCLSVPLLSHASATQDDTSKIGADIGVVLERSATPDLYTGAMSYQFPLEIPPARQGMIPDLALAYRTSNSNSWIGYGWDLDVGAIERTTKYGIDYSKKDFLLRKSGTAADLVTVGYQEYRLKVENEFARIIEVSGTGFPDRYFVATTKLGTKLYYGQTENSCVYGPQGVFKWALSKIEDVNGNFITYTYSRDNGQIYLDQIRYNGNLVKFYLTNRTDAPEMYSANFMVKTAKLLEHIEVIGANGGLVRAYYLNYSPSAATGRTILKSIKQYGNNISTDGMLREVSFSYTQSANRMHDPVAALGSNGPGGQTNVLGNQFSGDFNGDGKTDFMYFGSDGWYVALSKGNEFETPIKWLSKDGPSGLTTGGAGFLFVGDFNGDGKTDLLYNNNGWYVALSNGNGFDAPTLWLSNSGPTGPTYSGMPTLFNFVGDFDGDGKLDFMYMDNAGWYIAKSSGNSFAYPILWMEGYDQSKNLITYSGQQFLGDFNGDGKLDYMFNRGPGWYVLKSNGSGFNPAEFWLSNSGPWGSSTVPAIEFVGDFNGDGKADYMINTGYGAGWYVSLSNGNSFNPATLWLSNNGPNGLTYPPGTGSASGKSLVGDFNGDGKVDYMYYNNGWYVALSNGSSFNTPTLWLSNNGPTGETSNPGYQLFGDFNGDGKIDYLYNRDGWYLARNDGSADMLNEIKNGFGGTVKISYNPSSQYSNIQLPYSIPVVSSVTVDDGKTPGSTTLYSYSGGFFDTDEKEFRGFNRAVVEGPVDQNGMKKIAYVWFHQGNETEIIPESSTVEELRAFANVATGYMKGKPYRTRTTDVLGKKYSETTTSYIPDTNGASYFNPPYQVDSYTYDDDGSFTQTRTVYSYDSYGNVTREDRYGDVGNPANQFLNMTIVRSFLPNTTDWIVGYPTSETIFQGIGTANSGTNLQVSHTDYYYDSVSDCSTASTNLSPLKGNLTRVVRWNNGETNADVETRMAYDDNGNIKCSRDANGHITTTDYDSSSTFPIKARNELGHEVRTSYYGVDGVPADTGLYGQIRTVKDPNGVNTGSFTYYEYDKFGRKAKEVLPDGFQTTWAYNNFGTVSTQHVHIDNSAGLWSEDYFDGMGRTTSVRRKGPDTKVIASSTSYDGRGYVASKTLPYFEGDTPQSTSYTYDPLGRMATASYKNDLNQTVTTRACYGNGVTVSIDANNHRKRSTTDTLGRLVKVEEYQGEYASCSTEVGSSYATTTYGYDALGSLIRVTDAKNQATVQYQALMSYDSLGRKKYMNDPDMGEWRYDYDANGNLILQTDAKQQKIKFGYDALNRLRTKDFGADDIIEVTNTYDTYDEPTTINGIGRLTAMTDGSGSTKYYYDNIGRITSKLKTVDGTGYLTSFAYELGRLKSITYPDNETLTYHYDPAGNLDQAIGYATFAGFNALGQPGSVTYGNGVITSFGYFPANGRLQSIVTTSPTQGGLISRGYDYYDNGNVKSVTDNLNAAIPHSFVGESYASYPGKPHAIGVTGSGQNFQYDDNGNMTSDGVRTIAYNFENMPSSATIANSTVTFTYDGSGQRVKKSSASGTRVYIDNLYECGNSSCGKFIFAGNTRIALKRGTELLFYHQDHLGSTVAVTDGNGTATGVPGKAVETIAYYPFGETRSDTGIENLNHKYTSQENDYEIGLYNYNARLYSPEIGRFVSADPIISDPTNPQNLNRYSYVLNNLMNLVDPTGNETTVTFYNNANSSQGSSSTADGGSGSFQEDWKPWAQRFERIGREVGRWGRDVGNFFGDLFGGGGGPAPPPNYYLNIDNYGNNSYGMLNSYANNSVTNYSPSFGFPGGSADGKAVRVTLYSGARIFGHIGIGINTDSTEGFYPVMDSMKMLTGTPGHVRTDSLEERSMIKTMLIPINSNQAARMQQYINSVRSGEYTLTNHNCVDFCRHVLNVGGLLAPSTIRPRGFMDGLSSIYGSQYTRHGFSTMRIHY